MQGIREALTLLVLMADAVGLFPQLVLAAVVVLIGAAIATWAS